MKNNYQENVQEKIILMLMLYLEINNLTNEDIKKIYSSDAKLTEIYCDVCTRYSLYFSSHKLPDTARLQMINNLVEEMPLEAIRASIREKYPMCNLTDTINKRTLKIASEIK